MELDLVVSFWQMIIGVIVIASAFGVNTYMTNDNGKKTKENNKKIEALELKCNEMMKEKLARETFVTIELYKNEVDHLNKSLDELKVQNNLILECVRK